MNLLITKTCNRSCPYCFAKKEVQLDSSSSAGNISEEAFRHYLNFLKKSSINELKLLGGEPTMHPQFINLIDIGLDQGFPIILFSNGLWRKEVRDGLRERKNKPIQYLINVNEDKNSKERERAQLIKSLEAVGNQIQLSFNIYSEDFDMTFLQRYINQYGLNRSVRVGVASPIVGADNVSIGADDLKSIGKKLINQMKQMETEDILVEFDCGFTYCMFDEEDWGTITGSTKFGLVSTCDFIGDVDHNLDVWSCFPLSNAEHVNLRDFKKSEDIKNYYQKQFSSIRGLGSTDDCLTCKHLRRGQCCGGCLARTIEGIVKNGDSSILQKLNFEV